jgi:hypothetical protein
MASQGTNANMEQEIQNYVQIGSSDKRNVLNHVPWYIFNNYSTKPRSAVYK